MKSNKSFHITNWPETEVRRLIGFLSVFASLGLKALMEEGGVSD
jgi:hypothetical protein